MSILNDETGSNKCNIRVYETGSFFKPVEHTTMVVETDGEKKCYLNKMLESYWLVTNNSMDVI